MTSHSSLPLPFSNRSRADELLESFRRFFKANPIAWRLFCEFAEVVWKSGAEKYSAYSVMQRMRWHLEFDTVKTDEADVKLNNNHTPFFARLYALAYPERAKLFETRKLISAEHRPRGTEAISRQPASDETDIERSLLALLEADQE